MSLESDMTDKNGVVSTKTNKYNEFLRNFGRHFEFCVSLIYHCMDCSGLFTDNIS